MCVALLDRLIIYVPSDFECYHEMHGPDNCRENCVTRCNDGGPGDRASDSCHSDVCTSPPGLSGFGNIQFGCMDAPGSDDAGVGNQSFSETPGAPVL